MIKIFLGFAIIFTFIFLMYKCVVEMDDAELEKFVTKAPVIAACVIAAISAVAFIVVSF
jgi:uncharacterized membrane protein YdjX (TVP38/TMEM64 family)